MKLPRSLLVLLASLVAGLALPARATEDVPLAQQAMILVRALAYDRDIAADAAGSIDIAILSRVGVLGSEKAADKSFQAFKPLEKNTVAGLPVRVRAVSYSTAEDLLTKLNGVDAVYIPLGLDDDVEAIIGVARASKITTFAAKRSSIESGAALGVFVVGDRPTILINVAATKAEGASFSSELFKIARPIK